MDEGFGSDLVLGLPKVRSVMFSKVHQLGNVVLDYSARDGLDPVSSGPTLSSSLLAQESATTSLEASLKPEGSSPIPVHLFSNGSSLGAAELGERLCLSHYRKAREGRAVQMDEGLFSEFVAAVRLDFAGGIPSTLRCHS